MNKLELNETTIWLSDNDLMEYHTAQSNDNALEWSINKIYLTIDRMINFDDTFRLSSLDAYLEIAIDETNMFDYEGINKITRLRECFKKYKTTFMDNIINKKKNQNVAQMTSFKTKVKNTLDYIY